MSAEDGDFGGGVIVGVLLASILWFVIMGKTLEGTNDSWRKQIVEHKAAEWYLDDNHDRQWRWLPQP